MFDYDVHLVLLYYFLYGIVQFINHINKNIPMQQPKTSHFSIKPVCLKTYNTRY